MGETLMNMYIEIEKQGGLMKKVKLAMLTGIPSSEALDTPDSLENIKKFDDAVNQIMMEA